MKRSNYAAGVMLALCSTYALAQAPARPATPQVVVFDDLKQLIFDWEPVPGATYYRLYSNPDGMSGYTQVGNDIPSSSSRASVGIQVHLQHWQTALYKVSACNAAGCRDSKALFPRRHMLDTVGYFKASNPGANDIFGGNVVISRDGNTLVVAAPWEDSNATGVNGNQSNNATEDSGAAYVYRRVSGQWRQEAYLKATHNVSNRHFGNSLAISADGSVVAVGATGSSVGAGNPAGEVVTFTRASSGTWSVESTLLAPDSAPADFFGKSIDMSGDGQTLKVLAEGPAASSGLLHVGKTYMYARSGGGWQLLQTFAPWFPGDACNTVELSEDGRTLVQECHPNAPSSTRVVTFKRSGNAWNHVSDMTVGDTYPGVTMNYDAQVLTLLTPTAFADDVNIYRWRNSAWVREQVIPPPLPDDDGGLDDFFDWGTSIAFDLTGNLIAINSPNREPPAPAGVSETIPAGDPTFAGAVLLYQRGTGSAPWSFRSLIKAPNAEADDYFGGSVALSGSGKTLAIGARNEDGNASGIDGDRSNDDAPDAGAVYLY